MSNEPTEERVRLSLDVTKRLKDTIERIREREDHASITETIRHAVYHFDKQKLQMSQQERQHRKIKHAYEVMNAVGRPDSMERILEIFERLGELYR